MNTTRAQCNCCGSTELMSVSIVMADGPVHFWTCTDCETTSWERQGRRLTRSVALAQLPRR